MTNSHETSLVSPEAKQYAEDLLTEELVQAVSIHLAASESGHIDLSDEPFMPAPYNTAEGMLASQEVLLRLNRVCEGLGEDVPDAPLRPQVEGYLAAYAAGLGYNVFSFKNLPPLLRAMAMQPTRPWGVPSYADLAGGQQPADHQSADIVHEGSQKEVDISDGQEILRITAVQELAKELGIEANFSHFRRTTQAQAEQESLEEARLDESTLSLDDALENLRVTAGVCTLQGLLEVHSRLLVLGAREALPRWQRELALPNTEPLSRPVGLARAVFTTLLDRYVTLMHGYMMPARDSGGHHG